jgi:phosphinothricin acetyltransferase
MPAALPLPVSIRPATADDLPTAAAIYNEGIRGRCATFETRERTADDLGPWLDDPSHPFLVATASAPAASRAMTAQPVTGSVVGWIHAAPYRARACYDGIGDFSVYVAAAAQGRGVGDALMAAFLPACADAGLWKVLSRVFPENAASRALCARHGFREVGTYARHARLDGTWRDVVIVERLLPPALTPGA